MRNATKTALIAVTAVTAVLAVTVAAYVGAGTFRGTLAVTPVAGGHYGDELTITPSLNTTAFPGDVVELDYLTADNTWQQYGENLSVEDTAAPDPVSGLTTIGPLAFIVDDSLQYPAVLRAYFKPKAIAEGTCVSDPVWIRLQKNRSTKVTITAPRMATHGKSYAMTSKVTPVSGVGSIRVTVKRLATGSIKRCTITTDDSGFGTFSFKRTLTGRYRISEKFLGNRFGGPSATSTRIITVK